jgi:hypothetical protein
MSAPAFRITAIDCFERPLRYRMPFRFGAATVTHAIQAFVRARVRLGDGREAEGGAAELMVPKWFDKDPTLSNEANVDQLRCALDIARSVYVTAGKSRTAFGHFASHVRECSEAAQAHRLPALAGAFGPAEVDKAVLDALCRALNVSFYDAVRHDLIGFAPASVAPDVADLDARAFLRSLEPQSSLHVRHTVGMADPLRGHPAHANDGLPESLEEAIARFGLRWFKLKLGGEVTSDLARLRQIADVLEAVPGYRVTLDGNEQYDAEPLGELLRTLREDRSLRLASAITFVEQPLPRHKTFDVDVRQYCASFPMLIDEADASLDAFPRARARGYTGVSSKSCKGLYKSLVNALRCAAWNGPARAAPFFVSGEDLTTPAGLALQQDLALVSLLGIGHVERNGHYYIDGMASAPVSEQQAFLASHPDLYEASHGAVRLKVRQGAVALASLGNAGFASGALPDWNTLAPLRRPRTAAAMQTSSTEQ